MIHNVKSGQKITADNQNKIIDAVNTLLDGNNTNNDGAGVRQQSRTSYYEMFQCKAGKGFTMTARPNDYSDTITTTTWMFFGNNIYTFKKNVGLPSANSKVYLINSNNSAAKGEVTDQWIKRNGNDCFYDGWVDLQYPKYTQVYGILTTVIQKETKTPVGYYFVIDSESDSTEIENHLLTELGYTHSEYECKTSTHVCIANWTDAGHMPGDSGSGPSYRSLTQMHVGALLGGGGGDGDFKLNVRGDSQISATGYASINVDYTKDGDTNVYTAELYNFDNSNTISPNKGYQDLVVRDYNGSPTQIKYVQMGDLIAPAAFDIENGFVVRCKIMCGNKFVTGNDFQITDPNSDIYVTVTRTNQGNYELAVGQTYSYETNNSICVKLYEYSNGKVTCDVRPGYIPVFAL